MNTVFLTILNISITASYIALAAIALRFLLRKNPKWITCLLWALLAVRLILPFSFESKLSLIPDSEPVKVTSSASNSKVDRTYKSPVISNQDIDTPNTPVTPVAPLTPHKSEDTPVQDIAPVTAEKEIHTSEENRADIYSILSYVWAGGAVCMTAYSLISFLRIKRKVRASLRTDKKIYICDDISTPFILGIIKPKIYLPSALTGDELQYITSHEQAHLRRCDHLWKPLGFILLSLHWFNPLMWVSYILLCRDIELACDEKVLKSLGTDNKKLYSETLLSFSTERKLISACPLAFGEVGVKSRIKNIVNYKKPAFWITALSIILCVAVGFCFLTNPVSDTKDNNAKPYIPENTPDILPADCITDNYLLYTYKDVSNPTKTSHIKLYPENESFELMINPLSSYMPMGTYTIERNILTLDCDDDNQYVFEFLDSYTLMFIENESSELPEFRYSADDTEATKPFYDGTLFSIENTQYKGVTNSRATAIPYTYEEIVEIMIDAYPWNRGDSSSAIPDFPHASYMYYRHGDLSEVGYALIDLDKNGVDELVISAVDSKFIYDVYTVIDGETVHLFSSGERYSHTLYEDGYIHLSWSGSAVVSGRDFMKLNNGKLEFIERITLDAYYAQESGVIEKLEDAGNDNCFFKSTSRNTKNYVHISDDEAIDLIDYHQGKTNKLELVFAPLSTYTHGDIGSEVTQNRYVEFDIDGDGKDEICNVTMHYNSPREETPLSLMVFDGDKKEYYSIPDVTIDTTRSTATNVYLKRSDTNLYLFVEKSIGSREIYMLELKNNMIFITENRIAPVYLSDSANFDIDSDGEEDLLSLQKQWSSAGEYPFTITGTTSGGTLYCNHFVLTEDLALSFEQEDSKLYLVTTTLDALSLERRYEVIVEKGLIVLGGNGDTIPYYDKGYELYNQDFSYIIDQMRFDIDGDGTKEDVTITPGRTSGLFTFSIIAKRDGKTLYKTDFTGPALDFSFEKDKDGTVYLQGKAQNYIDQVSIIDSEIHQFDIKAEDSQIFLTENGVPYALLTPTPMPLPGYYSKVIDTLKKYEEGYNTHDVEKLNSCFDHTFIDPRDKDAIEAFVNTVTNCKIESVKFI